ncbi:ABC transporter permease [Brucella anthropi]|uniref:ABC transporter permease n=1 Tax=Brucella anthropi TaxID=529 RepID=UPI00124E9029|nr:ABC transporter permease [Brucella anthropi]KAB2736323.1 ABC transporter permease [Brucella anthropi]
MRRLISYLIPFFLTVLVIAVIMAVLLVPLALMQDNPAGVLKTFFLGPFGSIRHMGNVVEAATPIMLTGLAITIMFRSGLFNLGAESGFFLGALGAVAGAVLLPSLGWFSLPVAILCGAVAGSFACTIPAALRLRFGASEMVTSLVLNYAFLFLGLFVLNYVIRDPAAGGMMSLRIPPDAKLDRLLAGTRLNSGSIIAILACIAGGIWLYWTRSGFNIRIAGSSPGFANHLGLPLKGIIMRAQIVGGLVAGMAGALEVLGLHARFAWLDLPGYGWTGLVVAILARENPFLLIPSALFLGFVQIGGDLLARNMNIPTEVVGLVTAAIMVGATASVIHNHPTVLRLIRNLRNREGEQAVVQAGVQP